MIERWIAIVSLSLALPLGAATPVAAPANTPAPAVLESAQPQAVSGSAGMEDDDVYYAPEESGEVSGEMGASQGAVGSLPGSASYVSHAKLVPFEWGHPEKPLDDVELFLNGQFLGKSPLTLDGYMVQRAQMSLTARKDGFEESERPKVKLPVEGELRIALLNEGAASWYTTPAWIVGLGLVIASVTAYSAGSGNSGVALAGGGVGIIALSQIGAHFLHLPALRKEVEAYNQQAEPAP